jgi:hypothetical protein
VHSGTQICTALFQQSELEVCFLSEVEAANHLSYESPLALIKVKVKVTLRLAVYRHSVRLGVKPLETHDQIISFG